MGDEIEAEGRKLVGSAQARIGQALLQHGSLLLAPPSRGFAGVGSAGVSISEIAGRPITYDAVSRAVESSVMDAFPGRWSRGGLRPRERRVAASLLDHYESPGWTWRR